MKLKSNIDLGAAFGVLKAGLKRSEEISKEGNPGSYMIAHAVLSGFVDAHLSHCTEENDKAEGETQDDIPEQLFRQ